MIVEIVNHNNIPLSGEYDEVLFGITNDLLWVKFILTDWDIRYGKFDFWMSNFSKILETKSYYSVIISHWLLSVVDVNKRSILFQLENDFISNAIYDNKRNQIVVSDYTDISIYDMRWKKVHFFWEVSLDDVIFKQIDNDILFWEVNICYSLDANWWGRVPFVLDLENNTFHLID